MTATHEGKGLRATCSPIVALSPPALPRSFFVVLVVQFISTLADNAFLIVAIARVTDLAAPGWVVPLLKVSFTIFYVLLAPFVGPMADAFRKGRVMLFANLLKALAIAWLVAGIDPMLAITLAGLGAAIYAPAKYGLITEYLRPADLVRANGYFEGVTVCAVISGTVLGGLLVSPLMPALALPSTVLLFGTGSTALAAGMLVLLALNLLATVLSFAVADSGARYAPHSIHPVRQVIRFAGENRALWQDPLGGLSMLVTTLLWGAGATLQLIVLRWAHESLGLALSQAAYLQGITAVGVVAGAILASRHVALVQVAGLLPLGLVIGCLVPLMLLVKSVFWASVLLVMVGGVAGFFVVPMNALLQHRGASLLTAGRSIAVQGFNENGGMLVMLALYALASAFHAPLNLLIGGFSAMLTLGMAGIYWQRRRAVLNETDVRPGK